MQVPKLGNKKNEVEDRCTKDQAKQQKHPNKDQSPHKLFHMKKDLSETIKNIGKKYGIEVHFKSGKTLKDELVAPKDKRPHYQQKWHNIQVQM